MTIACFYSNMEIASARGRSVPCCAPVWGAWPEVSPFWPRCDWPCCFPCGACWDWPCCGDDCDCCPWAAPPLPRRLVGPPAPEFRSVPKAVSGKMVVSNFDHELRLERFPHSRAIGRPSARAAWGTARKPGWCDQSFELACELLLVAPANRRGEADVMQ